MKKNLQHIDEIRFLIIHLILINHSMLSYALIRDKVDQTLIGFWFEFTSPILALISGYLFFYGTSERFGYLEKIKRRFSSLVVPYVIWSLGFFVIYFLIKQVSTNIFHLHFWYEAVKPITLSNALSSLVYPPLVNFWYLQNLILIIPFNFVFYYLLKNRIASIVFFVFILFIFAYNPFSVYFSPRFLPFYMMGCYFGYHEMHLPVLKSFFRFPALLSNVLLSVIAIPAILYISVETGFIEYNGILLVLLKLGVVLFILISIYNLIIAYPDSMVFRYLKKYKPYSFFLFAIHTFIFTLVQRPLFKLVEPELSNKYFTLAFSLGSVIIVLILSLSIGIFVKKKSPGFFGTITGR